MTDLSKGIIEINGYEISANTTPQQIELALSDVISFNAITKNKKGQGICLKNIFIYGRKFDMDLFFHLGKIDNAKLVAYNDSNLSYEERFIADCEWLKNIFGEPSEINEDGNSYYFEDIHIYSFIQRDLSRNPAETFIVCKYGR